MKTYLAITGAIFALLTLLHLWKIVGEWRGIDANFWVVAILTLVCAALAVWAWKLLRSLRR